MYELLRVSQFSAPIILHRISHYDNDLFGLPSASLKSQNVP